jgi:lipopolysaccharide export system protein LptA
MNSLKHKFTLIFLVILLNGAIVFASNVTFSGGYTKVNLQEGNKSVSLTGGANISADGLIIQADEIELYGADYKYVSCKGNVKVKDEERGIALTCPSLSFDREEEKIISDGWIEIQDTKNEATLSGAWFEYNTKSTLMKIQMMAKIVKVTDDGLMTCNADSIEFNNETQTVTLKGNAKIEWNGNTYSAALIIVDLENNGITMHGSITGEVNG